MAGDEKPDTDDTRSVRRGAELGALLTTHRENVAEAHRQFPTPLVHKFSKFSGMTDEQKKNWNRKRGVIDSANRAYHLAVRRACAQHRDDDLKARAEFTKNWHEKLEREAAAPPPAAVAADEHGSEDAAR